MIDRQTVFEIHRLNNLGYSKRKIAHELGLDRDTVRKYLEHPERVVLPKLRTSKLDPYRDLINQFLESDPDVKAPVVLQRLCENGFDGEISIVRDYLRKKRGKIKNREAFIRFESPSWQTDANRLGALWKFDLWQHQTKTLCHGSSRRSQPYALCRIYPQSESGIFTSDTS